MTKIQSFSELFSLALSLFRKHIHTIALISVIPTVLSGAISAINSVSGSLLDGGQFLTFIFLSVIMIIMSVALVFVGVTYPVTVVRAIDSFNKGESVDSNAIYGKSFSDFTPYFLLTIATTFIFFGSTMVFIIPGVIALIYMSFISFKYTLEGKRGLDVIISSAWLIKGRFFDVFIRFFLLVLSIVVVSIFISYISVLVLGGFGFDYSVSNFVTSLIVSMFVAPFSYLFNYFLYKDLESTLPTKEISLEFAKTVRILIYGAIAVAVIFLAAMVLIVNL